MTKTTNSSTSADHPSNQGNEIIATPFRIEPIITHGKKECPKYGFIIATARNKYPLGSEQFVSVNEEEWTTAKLIDETFLGLMRVNVYISSGSGELIEVRKYTQRAKKLFWPIAAGKPTPEFTIEESDLTDKLRKELELDKTALNEWRQYVLKEAVGRIFEELSYDFYHLSVVKHLRVRLV